MAERTIDLGVITAYSNARDTGYTGTKAEFCEALKKLVEESTDSADPSYTCAGGLPSGASNNYYEINHPCTLSSETTFYVVGYQNSGANKTMYAFCYYIGASA